MIIYNLPTPPFKFSYEYWRNIRMDRLNQNIIFGEGDDVSIEISNRIKIDKSS